MNLIKKYWSRPLFASITVAVFFFVILTGVFMIADGDPFLDDQYFHFKYAYLLRTQGWDAVENFNWIQSAPNPSEIHGRYNVNLFQVSLMPFTLLNDWMMGMRVAEAFYASIVVAMLYYIMRKERVKYPMIFTLLLVSSAYFMMRILLNRAFVLMIGLIFVEMYFAIRKKYLPLLAVTLLHVLWHQNTYFMPAMVVVIVEFSRFLVDRKIAIKNMIAVALGIVVGMAFFPGFPRSLFSWTVNLFAIKENSSAGAAGGGLGGGELVTIDFSSYALGELIIAGIMLASVGLLVFMYTKREILKETINKVHLHWIYSLGIFTAIIIFGSMTMSGRFFDFLFPAIILLFAFIITVLFDTKILVIKKETMEWIGVFVWVFVVISFLMAVFSVYRQSNIFDSMPAIAAANWIDERSDDGEKVYLNNWSHFNIMFFANSNNVYSMGIEPYALRAYSEELYWKYYNIFVRKYYCDIQEDCLEIAKESFALVNGEEGQQQFKKENSRKIIESIKRDFGSKFILSDSKVLSEIILLNPEMIEDKLEIKSEKLNGNHMQFTVFELK